MQAFSSRAILDKGARTDSHRGCFAKERPGPTELRYIAVARFHSIMAKPRHIAVVINGPSLVTLWVTINANESIRR